MNAGTPSTGVYDAVPMERYHSWSAASNSQLKHLERSPAHLRAYLNQEYEEKPAQILGRAIHAAVLEPALFEAAWVKAPDVDRRTKAGKETWFKALDMAESLGAELLKGDDYETCLRVRDAVWASSAARGLLEGDGQTELSCLWRDRESGVLCKGRFDRFSPSVAGGAIVDLKTTMDASRLSFERTIFKFRYHHQGYMYTEGAKALSLPLKHYCIIAVEKEPPYGVGVYRLTEAALSLGGEVVRPLLERYALCKDRNEWPGYPDEVQDISLPPWAWNQTDDLKEEIAR